MSKSNFNCLDCGVDTSAIGEYYMLHDAVWKKINPRGAGMLCIGCAEKRLGRTLTPADFMPAGVNESGDKSARLLSRMQSGTDKVQLNGHKRAVIYCRVSTDEQAETGYSLESQIEACGKYAHDNGLTIAAGKYFDKKKKILVDEPSADTLPYRCFVDDFTGTKLDRPQFTPARQVLTDRMAEALIVYSSDRLTRKLAHKLIIREELQREGIDLHYVRRGKSEDTAENRMTENIEGVFDEYWREKILEASKRGRDTKARSGKLVGGHAPYGYTYHDGALIENDFEKGVVEKIYTWYVIGDETGKPLTCYEIAKRLSEEGIPTSGESRGHKRRHSNGIWGEDTVSRILTYEVYTGVFHYGRRIGHGGKDGTRAITDTIEIAVPALIDLDLWQAAQERKKHNRIMSPRNAKRDYLLRGLIFCGCGRRMVGSSQGIDAPHLYRCSAHKDIACNEFCHEPVFKVSGRKVEAWVREEILNVMTDPVEFEKALREAQQVELDALEPKRARLAVVMDLIKQCESEAAEVASALKHARGIVGAQLQAEIDQINKRYDSLSAERDILQAAVNARTLSDADIAAALQFREDVIEGLQNPTFDDIRRMLEILQVQITVKDGWVTLACCFPTFRPSFDLQTSCHLQVNRNRWIELRRAIVYSELIARPSLADQFFSQALTPRCEVTA